jgi:hypothetical protein
MTSLKSVPKTMSSPNDPGAPSFLTSLPPEMRNMIYEILFKRDEPVLVHNAEAYHAEPPQRSDYYDEEDFINNVADFDLCYDSEIACNTEFDYGFDLALSLLLSCRQI